MTVPRTTIWRSTAIRVTRGTYNTMNQYDLKSTPRITWDDLDQDLCDY